VYALRSGSLQLLQVPHALSPGSWEYDVAHWHRCALEAGVCRQVSIGGEASNSASSVYAVGLEEGAKWTERSAVGIGGEVGR